MQTLRVGTSGGEVETWQRVLVAGPKPTTWTNALGEARTWPASFAWPIAIDGSFGERTKLATEAWQAANGLVADGIVGPKTWDAAGAVTEATPDDPGAAIPFREARNFTPGRSQAIRLLVIHATHGPEKTGSAKNTANWFATQPRRGELVDGKPWGGTSAHYTIDRDEIIQSVRDGDVAWHGRSVNPYSIGIEHCGMGDQSAAQWEDDYSKRELARSAAFTAQLAVRYGIPVKRLSLDALRAGEAGFCGHLDVTQAFHDPGGHTDPGRFFPWDTYLADVQRNVDLLNGVTPSVAVAPDWVEIAHEGATWQVARSYLGPVGIGEAVSIAQQRGCVLPSPALVDAIWRAADLRLDATTLIRTDHTTMTAPDVLADQAKRIAEMTAGKTYRLLAGAFKDVVRHPDGRVGLYGWQRANGSVIQPFFAGHASAWRDYSQGLRLVRRVTSAIV